MKPMYVFLWKISTHDIVESNFWVKASLSDHSLIVVVMGISCYWHGADYERERMAPALNGLGMTRPEFQQQQREMVTYYPP